MRIRRIRKRNKEVFMKKKMVLTVAVLLVTTAMLFAQNSPESDFVVYRSSDGRSIIIEGYRGSAAVVNIPPRIQNLPVTAIDEGAFMRKTTITSITIPAGVLTIGNSAFINCGSLKSITIPNTVTSIGNSAFAGCSDLTSIAIPDSVTSIGNGAFSDSGLTNITIGSGVKSIGNMAFSDCIFLTSLTITAGTPPTIGANTFMNTPATMRIRAPNASAIVLVYKQRWAAVADKIVAQ
jgi:hypothetical protein